MGTLLSPFLENWPEMLDVQPVFLKTYGGILVKEIVKLSGPFHTRHPR